MALHKKRIQAIIVLIIALIIALTGTFAWFSFNQRATNEFEIKTPPNVNLHDDFEGGPQKDVYVENSGQRDVFVRVRLSEFMQIGSESLVPGAEKDDVNTWTAHVPNADGSCWTCSNNPAMETFHTYYEWTMGGRKFYRPAEESAKGLGDMASEDYREPHVVGDVTDYAALLKTAFAGDATTLNMIDTFLDYAKPFEEAMYQALDAKIKGLAGTAQDIVIWTNPNDPTETMTLSQIQMTLTEAPVGVLGYRPNEGITPPKNVTTAHPMVITMADWRAGNPALGREPFAKGDFWVVDTDGWAYWANPLAPGEATGMLLSYVDRTEKFPGDDAYYAIDVWLQAVTVDDLDRFGTTAGVDGGGGISNDGNLLMKLASGDYAYVDPDGDGNEPGQFFQKLDENVFLALDPTTFKPITDAKPFVGDKTGSPVGNGIITETSSIKVFNNTEGLAQGAELETINLADVVDKLNGESNDEAYELFVKGVNGQWYINLGDGSYAMTPTYVGDEKYDASEYSTDPRFESMPDYYAAASLGLGYDDEHPFVRVWPDSEGKIGTRNDNYTQQYVTLGDGTNLHFLGDGVYVVTHWDNVLGRYVDDMTTYYFSGADDGISDVHHSGEGDSDSYATLGDFEHSLAVGSYFSFEPGVGFDFEATAQDIIDGDEYTFQFAGMTKGTNGNWYILTEDIVVISGTEYENPQGENTKIKVTNEKDPETNELLDGGMLGNKNNVLVWATKPGQDDQYDPMSEPFLAGIKKADLLPSTAAYSSEGFNVDGAQWKVLDIDEYGNRLVLCDSLAGNKVTMGKSLYSQSNVRSEMQKIMATLPTINKYALPVNTPVWYRQLYSTGGSPSIVNPSLYYTQAYYYNDLELSTPKNVGGNWSTVGAEAFALSFSEAIKYSDIINNCNDSWWLRSAGKITGCGTKLPNVISGSFRYQTFEPTAAQICGTHDGLSYAIDSSSARQISTMGAYTDSFRCRAAMWVRFSDADKLSTLMGGMNWDDYQASIS